MLVNFNMLNSFLTSIVKFVSLFFKKAVVYVNFMSYILNHYLFATSYFFFFWKTSNYPTATWFLYNRKLNKYSSIDLL